MMPGLSHLGRAFAAVVLVAFVLAQVGRMRTAPPEDTARPAASSTPPVSEAPVEVRRAPRAEVPTVLVLAVDPLPVAAPAPLPEPAPPPLEPPPYPVRIPVAGITASDLYDSFGAARSGGRTHRALDILAPTGTPVLAAVDGHVVRTHTSDLGGLSVYQVGPDSAWVYYYAHLDAYAAGLRPGLAVAQGDTLGFVGETGNAPVPHLHFAVWKARPGRARLWGGRAINPYPLLKR